MLPAALYPRWINAFTIKAGLIATSNTGKTDCRQALNEIRLTFGSDIRSSIDILSTREPKLSVNKMDKHDHCTQKRG